jgi:hypothetical protein
MRALKTASAPEITAVGVEPAAIDAVAGAWRDLGLGAHSGNLGDMPVDMPVERDEREVVGLGDLAERVTAAQRRLQHLTFGMPADGAAAHRDHGMIGLVMHVPRDVLAHF